MGYVLRLSETNGYVSPWNLFQLAGMRQNETRTTGIRVGKLAMIANHSAPQLEKLAFSPSTAHPRWARLLGHPVVPTDIEITTPKLCPRCITEKGFVEAHWHLEIMVACPVHRCMALSVCPKCGNALSWFRPGLLECKCGGSLLEAPMVAVSGPTAGLLDVVRRRVLGLPANERNPECLPVDDLASMSLRTLLSVIRTLARHRVAADGNAELPDQQRVVSDASRVLVNWPTNFMQLLSDIGKGVPATGPAGVRTQFASIHKALFKSRAIVPLAQTEFMKLVFLDFAMNHWGRGSVDQRLAKQSGAALAGRYMTRSQFAARVGIQPRTVARLLSSLNMPTMKILSTKQERILIDVGETAIPSISPGRIYRDREAAKRLGLSVSVLKELKKTGLYEVKHLLPKQAGFHERDVHAFSRKLVALASLASVPARMSEEHITLQAAMQSHHRSLEIKIRVMRAILQGEIALTADFDGVPGGLLLNGAAYRELVRNIQSTDTAESMTVTEAATFLGCDRGTVPELVRVGLLKSPQSRGGLRVDIESADSFRRAHVSLASIAKELDTSSRALMCRLQKKGIKILFVSSRRKGGPQPFMSRSDRDALVRGFGRRSRLSKPGHGNGTLEGVTR
jgi:hypothetical protein